MAEDWIGGRSIWHPFLVCTLISAWLSLENHNCYQY